MADFGEFGLADESLSGVKGPEFARVRARPVGWFRRFRPLRGVPFVSGHPITIRVEVTGRLADHIEVRGRFHVNDVFGSHLEHYPKESKPDGSWRALVITPWLGPGSYRIDPEVELDGIPVLNDWPSLFSADVQSSDAWTFQLLTTFVALAAIIASIGGVVWSAKTQSDVAERQIQVSREIATMQAQAPAPVVNVAAPAVTFSPVINVPTQTSPSTQ